jgi:hypothetical protein
MRSVEQGGFLAISKYTLENTFYREHMMDEECGAGRLPGNAGLRLQQTYAFDKRLQVSIRPGASLLSPLQACGAGGGERERVEERITLKPVSRRGRTCIRLTRTLLEGRSLRSVSML